MEQTLRSMAGEGIDPRSIKLDWKKVMESQREKAQREVSKLPCFSPRSPTAKPSPPPATKSIAKWSALARQQKKAYRRPPYEVRKGLAP